MAVQESGVPTGFEADVESIGKVGNNNLTKKKVRTSSKYRMTFLDLCSIFFRPSTFPMLSPHQLQNQLGLHFLELPFH
jgi:hypothetical protein